MRKCSTLTSDTGDTGLTSAGCLARVSVCVCVLPSLKTDGGQLANQEVQRINKEEVRAAMKRLKSGKARWHTWYGDI